MRKILLATTALVAFAGAAQAAESPIQVTLGGSVDFRAALFHESDKSITTGSDRRSGDFQTVYDLTVAAEGKAARGIEYGAMIALDNDTEGTDSIAMDQAYVWMSGAFGKVLMGDEHGASDLFVYAPTVGQGQIDGTYTDFTDSLTRVQPAFVDTTENNTKVTYYTPKVGNKDHKVQLGVSYAPGINTGSDVATRTTEAGDYRDIIEASAQYTGTFSPVSIVVSPMLTSASSNDATVRSYTTWGLGAQAMYAGFTVGASYVDAGHFNTAPGADDDQDVWTLGAKYEFDKVAVAASYLDAESNGLDNSAIGLGAAYTWFPGLTTSADAVFFDQDGTATEDNQGHVLMLSQKMSF